MRISVITVCYNSASTLEQTIQSVIAQNYDELEYIIIDGGSTDKTLDIIRKYSKNITTWISEYDKGIYDAMNKGLRICTGEVVAFLNSDDWYDRDVLERVGAYFAVNDADIVSGKIYTVYGDRIKKNVFDRKDEENVFFSVIYPHPALFIKKKVFAQIGGYDTDYRIAADTDWIMRAYLEGARILKVDDYFTYFRDGGLSSRNVYKSQKEQYRAALSCVRVYGKWELEERIQEHYTQVLSNIRLEMKVQDAIMRRASEIRERFDLQKHYYIWGAGIRGKRCLEILRQLELPVDGFIDISDEAETDGQSVHSPSKIDTEHVICITPKGHETEIQEQLLQKGIPACNILLYMDLLERIAEYGNRWDKVEDI